MKLIEDQASEITRLKGVIAKCKDVLDIAAITPHMEKDVFALRVKVKTATIEALTAIKEEGL